MKLIYILLTLSLCFGCKSKRELSYHSEFKQEYQEQKDIREHEVSKRDSSDQKVTEIVNRKESDTETETVTKTTEYDTSKPITGTGKPPVIRETESTTRTKKKDKEDIAGKVAESSNVSDQSTNDKTDLSDSTQSTDNKEDLEQAKTTDFFKITWLWLIVIAMVIISIWYCIKKKINPMKWIFRM